MDVGEEESWALLLDLLIFPHSCLLNSITHRVGIQTLDEVKVKKREKLIIKHIFNDGPKTVFNPMRSF